MLEKLEVLKEIGYLLNSQGIKWAVGASLLLYFHGIVPEFNDIDIVVEEKDKKKVREIMDSIGKLEAENKVSQYATKHFLEYKIRSIDIDIMAGFSIIRDNEVYDCSFHHEDVEMYYDLDGIKIPLDSLDNWHKYYDLMGRSQKARLISDYMIEQKSQ